VGEKCVLGSGGEYFYAKQINESNICVQWERNIYWVLLGKMYPYMEDDIKMDMK